MQTTLYQLELDQAAIDCGMSYVIQLQDGRFIVIDGGYFTPGEQDRLFNFLTEHSSDRPIISAWYFSHAHQDHVGTFIEFMEKYRNQVTIEKLLYAFQPVDFSGIAGDWKLSDPATVKEFYRTVDNYCGNIEKIILHTGDRLKFGELTLDVLYTFEDLYPERAAFNDYSTVITTTVGDQSILWLGDVAAKASAILLKKPELRCDIVQVSHHGIDDRPELSELYRAINAKIALWPTPDYNMANRQNQSVNKALLHDMGIREHFCGGLGTAELPLPYSPGMATKYEKALNSHRNAEMIEIFDCNHQPDSPYYYLTSRRVSPHLKK